MDETQIRYFIQSELKKGTTIEELIFLLYDNNIPEYEISNFLDISIKYVENLLSEY